MRFKTYFGSLFLSIAAIIIAFLMETGFIMAQGGAVIKSHVEQIFVPVSVMSKDGKPITGLKQKDFHIYENGQEQKIINFYHEEVPLNVVFLMDISGSTFMEIGSIKNAIRTFVKKLKPQDRVAIITFNSEARLILDWSNDMTRLERALNRVVPKGSTVWYDALYVTYKDLLKNVSGKKVIISVTDGWDTASMETFKDVLDLVTSSDVQIFIISKTSGIKDYAEYFRKEYGLRYDETRLMKIMYAASSQLRTLAWDSGGRVIDPKGLGNLSNIYKNLVRELRLEYFISYSPYNILKDGRYRKITVRVERSNVIVHHRPGYYAR